MNKIALKYSQLTDSQRATVRQINKDLKEHEYNSRSYRINPKTGNIVNIKEN